MQLDGVDVFVAVVDCGSFSGAARRLGMPTTTVSARIARLEARLGTTLLHRTTRSLSLTDAGARYYGHCTRALAAMAEAERALAQDRAEPSGTLRLTAPADLCQSLLPPILKAYLNRFPAMSVDLVVANETRDLIADRIDLALRAGEPRGAGVVVRKVLSGRMTLWAAPGHPVGQGGVAEPADLGRYRRIMLKRDGGDVPLFWRDQPVTLPAGAGRVEADDMQTVRTLIEQEVGIGFLPAFEPAGLVDYGGLRPVLPGLASAPFAVCFAYPQQKFVAPAVRWFIDTALEVVKRTGRRKDAG